MIELPIAAGRGMPSVHSVAAQVAYDAATGQLRRLATGRPVTTRQAHGYIVIRVDGVLLRAHRVAWALVHGSWPNRHIDHVNGDRSDNRISNLREVDRAGNNQNLRKAKRGNAAGLLGVSWDGKRKKFKAQITVDGRNRLLGRFDSADDAHAAYVAAKRKEHATCTL